MKSQIEISPLEWELIENYLDQDDDAVKNALYESELEKIPNIGQKIQEVRKIREEIEDSIRQSKIKEFHNHIPSNEEDSEIKYINKEKKHSKTLWYAIAAALIVLFGIFWMMDFRPSSEKIFAENFKPDIGLPLKMGVTNNLSFYEGMLDYKQEKYNKAIEKWQVLLKKNPNNDTLNYFLGVANLAQGNADKSLEYLENQERFQEGIFKEDAGYYAGLAKIKLGKFEEAKLLLKKNSSSRNTNLLMELEAQ